MERIRYDADFIINEIPESDNGVGTDISLTPLYDQIKEARMEDDPRLSLGVWERELKKADWPLVESLAIDILSTKSKDLQIIAWLIEALISMDGFEGVIFSLRILEAFLDSFWYNCFPKDEQNPTDVEQKIGILIWIENRVSSLVFVTPFIADISLYNYEYAFERQALAKRSPEAQQEIWESERKNNTKTVDDIHNIIQNSTNNILSTLQNNINHINEAINALNKTLHKILKTDETISFSKVVNYVTKISDLITLTNTNHSYPNSKTPELALDNGPTRDNIYAQLQNLTIELKRIEQHSPSPFVLDLVVSWKNKSLFEIINDLQNGETEAHKLLKILLNK